MSTFARTVKMTIVSNGNDETAVNLSPWFFSCVLCVLRVSALGVGFTIATT